MPKIDFGVTCPYCHADSKSLSIDLDDVSVVSCSSCERTFTVETARKEIANQLLRWNAVESWINEARRFIPECNKSPL